MPHPTRRHVLRATTAATVATLLPRTSKSQTRPSTAPSPFYYVDGYHGGIDGHMPPPSLKNVLDGLDRIPTWKVSFEIEPYSWAAFAKSDPQSIERLGKFLADKSPKARIELVSGEYGQTYAWNISGEANIRHLIHGVRAIQAVFPDVTVDTYAVQEPCWTSCHPQLLKSLGYKRAVLKNSTCWGGYHGPTIDADLIHWTAPDGTSIPTVPRYASEGIVPPATIESSQPGSTFLDRCRSLGIANPSGTILQDMGWPGRPWRLGIAGQIASTMTHVTWREYVDTIAAPPTRKWQASQQDLRVGLAWGASIVQRIAQNVRRAETLIIQAEKIAALASLLHDKQYPIEVFDRAWKDLMFCQHHDVWIVPYNRRPGGNWASEADQRKTHIEESCHKVIDNCIGSSPTTQPSTAREHHLRIWNTTGSPRRDLISIPVESVKEPLTVVDGSNNVSITQTTIEDDKASVLAAVDVPAMGYTTVILSRDAKLPPTSQPGAIRTASAQTSTDGSVIINSTFHTLKIDPTSGGRISSLILRDSRREFIDAASSRSFHEFRGYFGKESRFLSSTESPATLTIEEPGPLRATVRIEGHIGPHPFHTRLSVYGHTPRIDVQTTFDFPLDASPFGRPNRNPAFRVGEPWPAGKDVTRSDRRPMYDSSYKLQALFPTTLASPVLHKNAPFSVEASSLKDTTFNSWATLQHNIVLNFLDLSEPQSSNSHGLAVFTDHTTAYSLTPNEPLGLVCCYAGLGTWFDYALGRQPSLRYALVPHTGNWESAHLWQELECWSEPLLATPLSAPPVTDRSYSLAHSLDPNVRATALHQDQNKTLLRLFNASGSSATATINLAGAIKHVQHLELDGHNVGDVPIDSSRITVMMPQFAVRTLQLLRD